MDEQQLTINYDGMFQDKRLDKRGSKSQTS